MRVLTVIGILLVIVSIKTALAQGTGAMAPDTQQTSPASTMSSAAPIITPINVAPDERLMFQLGDYLGKASFVDAGLVREINASAASGDKDAELTELEKLSAEALFNRSRELGYFLDARQLMWNIRAPIIAIAPIAQAIQYLKKPIEFHGQTSELAQSNQNAAVTLYVLEEYPRLSTVPDSPPLRHWIDSAAKEHNGHVWYAEGLISGISVIAAECKNPQILPKAADIATDLAGLRDWITIRLPDTPSPDQLALRAAVESLLDSVTKYDHAEGSITQYQLTKLGMVSKTIEGEVFGISDATLPSPVK